MYEFARHFPMPVSEVFFTQRARGPDGYRTLRLHDTRHQCAGQCHSAPMPKCLVAEVSGSLGDFCGTAWLIITRDDTKTIKVQFLQLSRTAYIMQIVCNATFIARPCSEASNSLIDFLEHDTTHVVI